MIAAYLALAAAIIAALATMALKAAISAAAAHALAPAAVAALWALALWAGRRARARSYHRHRYTHARSHAAPTLTRRVRLAARWLASVRIHITFGTGVHA